MNMENPSKQQFIMPKIHKKRKISKIKPIKVLEYFWASLNERNLPTPARNILFSILKAHGNSQKTALLPPSINFGRLKSHIDKLLSTGFFSSLIYSQKRISFTFDENTLKAFKNEKRYVLIDEFAYLKLQGKIAKTMFLLLKKQNTGKLYLRRADLEGMMGNENLSRYLSNAKSQLKKVVPLKKFKVFYVKNASGTTSVHIFYEFQQKSPYTPLKSTKNEKYEGKKARYYKYLDEYGLRDTTIRYAIDVLGVSWVYHELRTYWHYPLKPPCKPYWTKKIKYAKR